MNNLNRLCAPAGWGDVIMRAVMTLVAAFATLVLKEWIDTRELDLPACATDAGWIAGGVLVLNAILMIVFPRGKSDR